MTGISQLLSHCQQWCQSYLFIVPDKLKIGYFKNYCFNAVLFCSRKYFIFINFLSQLVPFCYLSIPEVIFVVFDVAPSSHPADFFLLSIFLTVYQWLHSIIVQAIRLTNQNTMYQSFTNEFKYSTIIIHSFQNLQNGYQ